VTDPARVYIHGHHQSVIRSHARRTAQNSAAYLLGELRPGMDLLDVGCGPGTITLDLNGLVAPGRVVGVDAAEDPLIGARIAAQEQGATNVTFEAGDAYQLRFEDASFDVVHAHQVLQHLTDPVAALREFARVCKPTGLVACRDADYAAMTWFPELPGLARWLELYQAVARANDGEPNAGRRLLAWAHQSGFREVTATASTWCYATPDDRGWWGGLWAERVTGSTFAEQSVGRGLATREELDWIAGTWREWTAHDDAWFAILHGEIVCRGALA
jgi:SAM-dependent methyltransferase